MGGLLTNSSPGKPANSPEDTFNKLRRIPYPEACVEYTMAMLDMHVAPYHSLDIEEIRNLVDPILEKFGWTLAELNKESHRLENAEKLKEINANHRN